MNTSEPTMSSTRVIDFMYHHHMHCAIPGAPPMPSKSPDSFTLFPNLPPEIRLQIWEAIASEPHTVELSCTPTASHMPKGRWFSHSKPPILFTISSESRSVAQMQYCTLDFSLEQIGIPSPKLYINFSVDTLWLCGDVHILWARDLLEKNEQLKTKLTSLAVNETMWKALNPVFFTPGFAMTQSGVAYVAESPEGVRSCLKALERLQFHS